MKRIASGNGKACGVKKDKGRGKVVSSKGSGDAPRWHFRPETHYP